MPFKRKINAGIFSLLYFAGLFLICGIWQQCVEPALGLKSITALLTEDAVFRILILVFPALVCLCSKRLNLRWPVEKLVSRRIPWRNLILWCCGMLVVLWSIRLYVYGSRVVLSAFEPVLLLAALLAGVTEEFVFRGFLLNLQMSAWPTAAAIVVNVVCFLLFHYTELLFGLPLSTLLCGRTALLFGLGAAFSLMMIQSGNLLFPVLMHTLWDVAAYLLGLY